MSLDVICAGFGRTGTLSLKAALEILGYSPCWHIEHMFIGVGTPASHLDAWHRLSEGEPMNWNWLLEGFRAASDIFGVGWSLLGRRERRPQALPPTRRSWHRTSALRSRHGGAVARS